MKKSLILTFQNDPLIKISLVAAFICIHSFSKHLLIAHRKHILFCVQGRQKCLKCDLCATFKFTTLKLSGCKNVSVC